MELGGNDAMIICADADLEKAAKAVVLGRLARGNGQICCAVKRMFVQADGLDRFADILTQKAKGLKVGDQLLEDTDVGPLINEQAANQVEARHQGCGPEGRQADGRRHGGTAFIEPTVLTDISPEVELFREETFGPVVPLVAFTDVDEAIRMANDTPVWPAGGRVHQRHLQGLRHRLPAGGGRRDRSTGPRRCGWRRCPSAGSR